MHNTNHSLLMKAISCYFLTEFHRNPPFLVFPAIKLCFKLKFSFLCSRFLFYNNLIHVELSIALKTMGAESPEEAPNNKT